MFFECSFSEDLLFPSDLPSGLIKSEEHYGQLSQLTILSHILQFFIEYLQRSSPFCCIFSDQLFFFRTMNFWDKVQHEIQTSTSRLSRGRKDRRGSSDSPQDSVSNSPPVGVMSGFKFGSPKKKNSVVMDDDMGLADEILASPVHERQKDGRGISAIGSRGGLDQYAKCTTTHALLIWTTL